MPTVMSSYDGKIMLTALRQQPLYPAWLHSAHTRSACTFRECAQHTFENHFISSSVEHDCFRKSKLRI